MSGPAEHLAEDEITEINEDIQQSRIGANARGKGGVATVKVEASGQ
jgi:hypothetical protein